LNDSTTAKVEEKKDKDFRDLTKRDDFLLINQNEGDFRETLKEVVKFYPRV
jgi:hypothetical protein